jgi:hypothetical protein
MRKEGRIAEFQNFKRDAKFKKITPSGKKLKGA